LEKQIANDLKDIGTSILIVDDEETVRDVCRQMLVFSGMPERNVFLASNNEEACEIFQANENITLVLCDISRISFRILFASVDNLPVFISQKIRENNGHSLIDDLRECSDRDFMFIINSGYDKEDIRQVSEEYGASGYMQKPITREALVKIVRKLFDTPMPVKR